MKRPTLLIVLALHSQIHQNGKAAAFVAGPPSLAVVIQSTSVASFKMASDSTSIDEIVATTTTTNSVNTKKGEDNNPRLEGLALMLDDGTRKSHSMAQNTAFVSGFFKGLSTKESYRNLLTSLYFVYQDMELAFDECQLEEVKLMDDKELRRLDALTTDMDYFYGQEWKSVITPSLFTQKYVTRIQEVAATKPYLLIAHQYTRYLGDLFGGQMMGGMASRSLDLGSNGDGVAFYTFDEIDSAKNFITDWYSRLNSFNLTQEQKQEIVDEANLVFDLNVGILEELEGSPFKAIWSMAIYSLKEKLGML